ncbi:MAG: segregation and condensation protein A [Parcubacteria group bacterium Gr01-1014_106]|nr:MAG: segregation and condensation protein A [Parcubacteria group bacterium Gr01-1014_106]
MSALPDLSLIQDFRACSRHTFCKIQFLTGALLGEFFDVTRVSLDCPWLVGQRSRYPVRVEHTTPETAAYTLHPVSVPGFEGPLDLLLTLIEEGKLDISAISLATVTEQYLTRLRGARELPPEHLAEFLVVAATLLLLKSRKLFPDLRLSEEEETSIASLEAQLREYRKFRDAARTLAQQWHAGRTMHGRESFLGFTAAFYPPPQTDGQWFRSTIETVVQNLPKLDVLPHDVLRRVVSLEERINDMQSRLMKEARMSFESMRASTRSKVDVIVSFLALLELVKQRIVAVEQTGAFRDILVTRQDQSSAV